MSESELDPKALGAAMNFRPFPKSSVSIRSMVYAGTSQPDELLKAFLKAYLASRSPAQPEGVTDAMVAGVVIESSDDKRLHTRSRSRSPAFRGSTATEWPVRC